MGTTRHERTRSYEVRGQGGTSAGGRQAWGTNSVHASVKRTLRSEAH